MVESYEWFYFAGGRAAKNIDELITALEEISNDEFSFHVNGTKNDFANWIEGVFGEKDLADEMRHVMEKQDMIRILDQFVNRNSPHDLSEAVDNSEATMELQEHPEEASDKPPAAEETGGAEAKEPEAAEMEVKEHETEVKIEEPSIVVEGEHQGDELMRIKEEHELSEKDLHELADDVKHSLEIEGRKVPYVEKKGFSSAIDPHMKFIIKEFVFGFALGLIFGLIMLGSLYQIYGCSLGG